MRRRLTVLTGLMAAALVIAGCSPAATPPNMPPWMQKAPAQVQDTYAFAVAHPEVLESVPCYCGCVSLGHASNRDCFIEGVAPDGKVTYDIHAAG